MTTATQSNRTTHADRPFTSREADRTKPSFRVPRLISRDGVRPSRLGLVATTVVALVTLLAADAPAAQATRPVGTDGSERVLRYEYEVQKTQFWCSAAAARMALSARGKSVTQRQLADYMKLNPAQGLPNIANLASALNHFTGSGYYQVKQWSNDAQLRDRLRADVVHNINRHHAVVINVRWLPGQRFDGHYATIVGYRNSGDEFLVADPATAGRRHMWLSADTVAQHVVKLRRYVA